MEKSIVKRAVIPTSIVLVERDKTVISVHVPEGFPGYGITTKEDYSRVKNQILKAIKDAENASTLGIYLRAKDIAYAEKVPKPDSASIPSFKSDFFHLAVRAARELGIQSIPLLPSRLLGQWDMSLLGHGGAGGLLIDDRTSARSNQGLGRRDEHVQHPSGRTAQIEAFEAQEVDRARIIEKIMAHKPDIIIVPHYEYETIEPHLVGYKRIITVE